MTLRLGVPQAGTACLNPAGCTVHLGQCLGRLICQRKWIVSSQPPTTFNRRVAFLPTQHRHLLEELSHCSFWALILSKRFCNTVFGFLCSFLDKIEVYFPLCQVFSGRSKCNRIKILIAQKMCTRERTRITMQMANDNGVSDTGGQDQTRSASKHFKGAHLMQLTFSSQTICSL